MVTLIHLLIDSFSSGVTSPAVTAAEIKAPMAEPTDLARASSVAPSSSVAIETARSAAAFRTDWEAGWIAARRAMRTASDVLDSGIGGNS